MKNKKINIDNFEIQFDNVDVNDSTKWRVIKSESYLPDKDEFTVKCWKRDYSEFETPSAETIYKLCSRSKNLSEWLQRVNLEYVINESPPDYLKDFIDPKEFNDASSKINEINKLAKDETLEITEESIKYRKKIESIRLKYSQSYDKLKVSNFIKIINLKSNDMPISFIMAIENFSPAKGEDSPKAKTYSRELLLTFKKGLLEFIKDKPSDFNIDPILDSLKTK